MVLFPVFTVFTVFSMDFILVSMDFILVCASACWVFTRDSNLVAQAGAPSIFEANFWASKDTSSSAWSFDEETLRPARRKILPATSSWMRKTWLYEVSLSSPRTPSTIGTRSSKNQETSSVVVIACHGKIVVRAM
jgi:hypothetical protein